MKYNEIAPFVGLDPGLQLRDATSFTVYRARIPTVLFKNIVQDIEIVMKQYGPPIDHQNVEARSIFLAPVSVYGLFRDPILICSCSSSTEP